MSSHTDPLEVMRRLEEAANRHDLDALVACFAEDYRSEQPVHPARRFDGSEQVRQNWSRMFIGVPDIRLDMLRHAVAGDEVWTEWRWWGTYQDETPFDMRGVTIFRIRDGQVRSASLFMEPVLEADPGIDAVVGELSKA